MKRHVRPEAGRQRVARMPQPWSGNRHATRLKRAGEKRGVLVEPHAVAPAEDDGRLHALAGLVSEITRICSASPAWRSSFEASGATT